MFSGRQHTRGRMGPVTIPRHAGMGTRKEQTGKRAASSNPPLSAPVSTVTPRLSSRGDTRRARHSSVSHSATFRDKSCLPRRVCLWSASNDCGNDWTAGRLKAGVLPPPTRRSHKEESPHTAAPPAETGGRKARRTPTRTSERGGKIYI